MESGTEEVFFPLCPKVLQIKVIQWEILAQKEQINLTMQNS